MPLDVYFSMLLFRRVLNFGDCIKYKDKEFTANDESLGEYEAAGGPVHWVRGDDILAPLEDVDGDGKIGKTRGVEDMLTCFKMASHHRTFVKECLETAGY